ncbi:MAG: ATP-dependent protease La [Ignavibacteriae bacterium]|nr:MAG: ATP-dependent protease La [Ignavibacteriota bacterium]
MKLNFKKYEVQSSKLRWKFDPNKLKIKTTDDVKFTKDIIGQERALRSLKVGLEIKHFGYNVFVTGFSGTGRTTTIKRLLKDFQNKKVQLYDFCYLYNFDNPDQPHLVKLKAGQGNQLKKDMNDFLEELLKDIPAIFESRRYQEERKRIIEHFQSRQRTILKQFEDKVKAKGFEVIQVQVGSSLRPDIAPVINNAPVNFEQIEALIKQGELSQEKLDQLIQERKKLETQMESVFREMRNIERKLNESLEELGIKSVMPLLKEHIEAICQKYECEKLKEFLDDLEAFILSNLEKFLPQQPQQGSPFQQSYEEYDFIEFKVNVVVDNSKTEGIPVIIETNPRFKNVFGTIDREVDRNGIWRSDFTMIKAGSLLKANGGYLILNALDTIVEPGVWQTLKRTLRNQLLEIQSVESGLFGTSSTIKPEPIELDVKVIMIGDAYIYEILYEADEDFKKIFKIRADFDTEMPRNNTTIRKYISFIKMICEEENLLPFDKYAIAEVVEFGVRLAGRQNKMSTRFNIIADVLRESNFWAKNDAANVVKFNHVRRAIEERAYRLKMIEEKIQEMIVEGTLMIDHKGKVVGQVNGLSVYDMGEYSFGKPSRITVTTAMGKAGVINIEREAELSGPTHNKGVLILSGYLRSKYAQNKPLVMSASIAFEQSYSGVDGDSASSTEIYAILSSLSGVPIRQDIAVTGSVNQKGEIQPIGGVNEKIEGFYDVCKQKGFTGTQGVIIPYKNLSDLMLRHDVVEDVQKGRFHIYAIKTIDEGIEILTGKPAGKKLPDGSYPKGTIHYLVDKKLAEYAEKWKEIEAAEEE